MKIIVDPNNYTDTYSSKDVYYEVLEKFPKFFWYYQQEGVMRSAVIELISNYIVEKDGFTYTSKFRLKKLEQGDWWLSLGEEKYKWPEPQKQRITPFDRPCEFSDIFPLHELTHSIISGIFKNDLSTKGFALK